MSALTEGRRGLRLQTSRLARMPRRWRLCSFSPRRTLVNARTRSETTRPRCLSQLVNGHSHESMHPRQTFTYLGFPPAVKDSRPSLGSPLKKKNWYYLFRLVQSGDLQGDRYARGVYWREVQPAHVLACSHDGVL
jgi:hypothetical protein